MRTFAYDRLEYPSHGQPQTFPDRLATLATLFGMHPQWERCRVLELGCGDGLNLISIAVSMPDCTCEGIDLSACAVQRGQAMIDRIGLGNVTLRRMDLSDVSAEFGEFDYIIAHGLYSWVPVTVRDRLLEICRRNLAPQGVAYVSYNALPGGHLRQMCRRMMMYHTRQIDDPLMRVRESKKLLQLLIRAHQKDHPIASLLKLELQRIGSIPEAQVFHDDLAPINEAVYFDEFVKHAEEHGLQFLAEAELELIGPEGLPQWVQTELRRLSGHDVVAREMYMDFLRDRTFRQSLLCRSDVELSRPPTTANIRKLLIASSARPLSGATQIGSSAVETFRGQNQAEFSTNNPLLKAAMNLLSEHWPRAIGFSQLVSGAESRAHRQFDQADEDQLAEVLLRLCASGMVEFHVRPSPVVLQPGERPLASPLARLQAEGKGLLTSLHGASVPIEDPLQRRLIQLLDGTRDRAALIDALVPVVRADRAALEAKIELHLRDFGRVGLLIR